MSSLWKPRKSQYWTACWRDIGGKQCKRSTKTTDRRLAKRIAEEYERASRTKRTIAQVEKVIRSLHEELGGPVLVNRSLRGFLTEWLAEREPSISPATLKFYHTVVTKLFAFFGPKADKPMSEITESDLISFRNSLAQTVSPTTTNHFLTAVRTIFATAKRKHRTTENPAEHIEPVRNQIADKAAKRPFTIDELKALLAVADPEWASMVRIGLYSGARLGDIANLRWSNIDFERDEFRYTARKTGRTILLPLANPLKAHLLSLPSADDPQAPLHARAFTIVQKYGTVAALSRQFGELLEQAGLRSSSTTPSRRKQASLSFHSLRHTAVSLLKDAGVSQATAMAFAGHSSTQMSAHYTHVDRQSLLAAGESLPTV